MKEYYQKKVKDYPKDRTWISILKEYHTTFLDDQRKKDKDVGQLIDLFLSKKENIKDYSKDKIDKCYASISHEVVDIVSVFKFYDSMIEYQSYLKFKFLIDDVKKLYLERDKYKNVYKQSCKEIKKHEGKILKYTKKVLKPGKFCRSKKELLELKINEEIGQVRGLYEELELKKFYEKVVELTDDTTYYDILNLTASYYLYLRECFKQEFPDITDEEVNRQYEELKRFLVNPNITMMYNFSIKEEFDIPLIISDRYKLLGFCVSKEDIINNLDGLIEEVHKIILSYRITSSQISYEDLLFLCRCSQL